MPVLLLLMPMCRYSDTEETFTFSVYHCSHCSTSDCHTYQELKEHTQTAHGKNILTCSICGNMFLNYGSLISHVCSGPPTSQAASRARFACKVTKLFPSTPSNFLNQTLLNIPGLPHNPALVLPGVPDAHAGPPPHL